MNETMGNRSLELKHYLTCLWPGVAEIWWRGRLSAMPAAIAFAAVINALLVAKFIYSDWLSGSLVMLAFWVVAGAWLVLTIRSIRELPSLLTPREVSEEPDRFPQAHEAYLKGDYAAAEEALTAALAIEPRDPPALLLLSAVYRHTGRFHASGLLLDEIRKLEAADAWDLEWNAEVARLERDVETRSSGEVETEPDQPDGGHDEGSNLDGELDASQNDEGDIESTDVQRSQRNAA